MTVLAVYVFGFAVTLLIVAATTRRADEVFGAVLVALLWPVMAGCIALAVLVAVAEEFRDLFEAYE